MSRWEETRIAAQGRVPPGFRPMQVGDIRQPGDMLFDYYAWIVANQSDVILTSENFFSATRRPAAKPARELHEDEGG